MDTQITHDQFTKCKHDLDIVIFCDQLSSPANIGGVFRLADAYGAGKIIFYSEDKTTLSPKVKAVSRGAQNFVEYEFVSSPDILNEDPERNWYCLEITENSTPVAELKLSNSKIGVIIGNESKGVSYEFLKRFPAYHLKMFGNNSSMNVTNSLSAILFYITQIIK